MSGPTPEQIAERSQRADKATRGALAAVLCLEAFCVLLVPRAIAQSSTGLDATKTWLLVGYAVVLIAVGFVQRRRWGIGLGSVAQLTLLPLGLWTSAFVIIAVIFIGIWLYILNIRREVVTGADGWRILLG